MSTRKTAVKNVAPYGWWIASYLERHEFKDETPYVGSSRCTVYENAILVRAKTRELAYERALRMAKERTPKRWSRWGRDRRLGRWVVDGLTSLLPIYEELKDGAELWWRPTYRTTIAAAQKRVKPRRELEVFKDDA